MFDVSADASSVMKAKGAQVFTSTQELAKSSEFVITMLPNNDIVRKTYEDMIKDGVNSKTLFVDSSTVDPTVSQYVQKIVSAKGASFVDAPVSGGVMGAQNATLTFMVGGTADEYNRVKGFLEGRLDRVTSASFSDSNIDTFQAWERESHIVETAEWVKLLKSVIT